MMPKDQWDQFAEDCAVAQMPHCKCLDAERHIVHVFPLALVEDMAAGRVDMGGDRTGLVHCILRDWLRRLKEEARERGNE